jgi:hypothetical protein
VAGCHDFFKLRSEEPIVMYVRGVSRNRKKGKREKDWFLYEMQPFP